VDIIEILYTYYITVLCPASLVLAPLHKITYIHIYIIRYTTYNCICNSKPNDRGILVVVVIGVVVVVVSISSNSSSSNHTIQNTAATLNGVKDTTRVTLNLFTVHWPRIAVMGGGDLAVIRLLIRERDH